MSLLTHYAWLTVNDDGSFDIDMLDTTPAEMDRRLVIAQELQAGHVVLAEQHRAAAVENERLRAALSHIAARDTAHPASYAASALVWLADEHPAGGQ